MSTAPIIWEWTPEGVMVPLKHFRRRCDEQFVVHETYRFEVREERSIQSHNFYFANVVEAHRNLPDHWAQLFPTPEHLRKYALIQCGYCDERSIVCASNAEANRLRAFIKPLDEFAAVAAKGNVVSVYTAQSQSVKAMDRKKFNESKTKTLDYIAGMIGTDAATLRQNAEAAA
jgi:hypothetical protein